MSEGPTVVGSIVGQLKLDDSDLNARLDAAEARAKEFEADSPTIKVKANVKDAMAALDAVNAAEKKLQVTETASEAATQRAILAQMRLNDVQTARGRTDYQVAAAELALEQATQRADSAAEKAIAADDALADARLKLLAVTDALAAGEGEENQQERFGNDLKNQGFSRITAIIAAVAALIPLLGPLGAYSVAAGGSLLGMGAVGVLAILGIKNAMKDGTDVGNEYAAGIRSLKGDLSELEQTAAGKLLTPFDASVSQLHAALPALNQDVGEFAGILGGAGNTALSGAISALHVLNPLFVQAAMYVGSLTEGFQKWATGNGIQKFASYAEQALPQVANLLGNLATAALNIVEALAPAGTAMVTFLNIVANVLDFLAGFGPGFAVVVGGATAAYAAFKLFGSVTPLIQAITEAVTGLGIAEQASLGPIGLVVAGITALVAIIGVSVAATNQATDAVNTYAAAVEADNGVIGENVRLQAAKNLQDSGAIANAIALGAKTDDLVKAALGDADARKKVNEQLLKGATALEAHEKATLDAKNGDILGIGAQADASAAYNQTTDAVNDNAKAIKLAIKAYNDLAKSEGGTSISTKAELKAQQDLADTYGQSLSTFVSVEASQRKTAAQAAATTLSLQLENNAATLLTNALTLLDGGSLDLSSAQTGLYAASNAVTDSLKQNGKVIDGNSEKAVANQQAIESQVSAAQAYAEAVGKATGSSSKATAAYVASKDALEAQLSKLGELTPQMKTYIDQLYDVANLKVPPTKIDVDTATAMTKLSNLQKYIKNIEGGSVTMPGVARLGNLPGHSGGGTVGGIGSTMSDSNVVRLSRGEEVIKASSASQGRAFLKAFNSDPAKAMAAVGAGNSVTTPASHSFQIYEATDANATAQKVINRLSTVGAF